MYVDVALVSRAAQQVSDDPLGRAGGEDTSARYSIGELLDRRSRVVLALVGPPGQRQEHPARPRGPAQRPAGLAAGPGPQARPRPARAARAGRVDRRRPGDLAARRRAGRGRRRRGPGAGRLVGAPAAAGAGAWSCSTALTRWPAPRTARAVADWVERQIAAYPATTSWSPPGPSACSEPLTAQADVLVVRPFTAEQVQLFLDRWYLAAEQHATGASGRTARRAVRMRAQESAARLTALLRENPGAARPGGQSAAADDDRHGAPVPRRAARQPRRPVRRDLPGPAVAPGPGQGPARAPVLASQADAAWPRSPTR